MVIHSPKQPDFVSKSKRRTTCPSYDVPAMSQSEHVSVPRFRAKIFFLVALFSFLANLAFAETDPDADVSFISHKYIGLTLGHLFFLFVGIKFVWPKSRIRFGIYILGYVILYVLLGGYAHRELLMMLFSLIYAATFHTPLLFAWFLVFIFSFVLYPYYAFAEFVVGILLVTGVHSLWKGNRGIFLTGSFLWGSALLVVLILPLVSLVSQSTPQEVFRVWEGADQTSGNLVRSAIWLSLKTATISTLILAAMGIPLAYALARARFTGRQVLLTMIDIPIVIPQPIVGIALLQFIGEKVTLGAFFNDTFGLRFSGATAGIVLAQVFVSTPFLIRAAMAAFEEVDPKLERVARTLGANAAQAFGLVALPLAARGIFAGLILGWARAISEFGSILILAEFPETAPVMIYHLFIRHGLSQQTLPAVVLLIFVCLWCFIGLHLVRTVWGGSYLGGGRNAQHDQN
jgi:molybdate/tungstate transport system permease protein